MGRGEGGGGRSTSEEVKEEIYLKSEVGRAALTSEQCEEQWKAAEQLQGNGRLRSQHVEQRLERCFNPFLSFTKPTTTTKILITIRTKL